MSVKAQVHLHVWGNLEIPEYLMTPAGTHAVRQPGVMGDAIQEFLMAAMQDQDLHRYVSWSFVQQESGWVPQPKPEPQEVKV